MNEIANNLICRHCFNTQDLIASHPPKLHHPNKKVVYQIACPTGAGHQGELVFSRWHALPLPQTPIALNQNTVLEAQTGYFKYTSAHQNSKAVEWYLNFADTDLFFAYGGGLFAQDEMQVAEHPALASLREALLSENITLLTVEDEEPTPVLVRGVERRCTIAIDANAAQERPWGLYGNHFARATIAAVQLATQPLHPPTVTNIIAMAAPACGFGTYSDDQIEFILTTALTAFSAARLESRLVREDASVIIHTGFWGCGAFGGNRVLMALLQLLAAHLGGIDRLVFHTGDGSGAAALATAEQILHQELGLEGSSVYLSDVLSKIYDLGFQWGVSDGN